MDRWQNKVAVVTGASSGIGAACVKYLANAGMVVVGLARREERVKELRASLPSGQQSKVHAIKCDVTKEDEVLKAFEWIEKNLGGVDVLVNNAGVVRSTDLTTPKNSVDIKAVVDTNIMGVVFCVREAFNSMKARKVDGHVIIVNSIAGHKVPNFPGMNIYPATKYAVTAMTETYRQEFAAAKTNVKVTSISPGLVDTEIINDAMKEIVKEMPILRSEDIADAVLYVIGTPAHVQIHELTIKPVGEVF